MRVVVGAKSSHMIDAGFFVDGDGTMCEVPYCSCQMFLAMMPKGTIFERVSNASFILVF